MSVAYDQHQGPWTIDDVLALPEDTRQRIELVGGALVMSPSPGVPHQLASSNLHAVLRQAARAAGAPVAVLEAINVVGPDGLLIPDLAVVDLDAARQAKATVSAHDVLLVVEIASPSTRVNDVKVKPLLYAEAGIPAYWRLELEPRPRLTVTELENGSYVERVTLLGGSVVRLSAPFPVDLDPAELTQF